MDEAIATQTKPIDITFIVRESEELSLFCPGAITEADLVDRLDYERLAFSLVPYGRETAQSYEREI